MRAALATGRYDAALKTYLDRKEDYGTHIEFRAAAVSVLRFNNRDQEANALLREIETFYQDDSWRYTDASELTTVGRTKLILGADAKLVLERFYDRARQRDSSSSLPYQAIAELALAKNDFTLAIKNFRLAVKLDSDNPDLWFGLAKSLWASNRKEATASLEKALQLNPNHAPTLNFQIDSLINSEAYAQAQSQIDRVLKINPHNPQSLAYRAVIAHLENQPREEGRNRNLALGHWKRNPAVDHLIGSKLSQKYRFKESIRYQRRALVYDPSYLPAQYQLAHDLLRTGQEMEGWNLAQQIFDKDQYSVVAHNLVQLRNELSGFKTLERDGFVVRMSQQEAKIYGEQVLQLLSQAQSHLAEKYQTNLETPIFVEIFPQQQDFAIRTFGLPGGEGFLGVCFGRLITMNSPAAQGPSPTNWRSVLWHEFCHVVTLQKTANRMPRWLSEGISVYEERLKDQSWGQAMNIRYRGMMTGEDVPPISKLSGAFLNANSAEDVDFAYFLSAAAVEFLVQEYGFEQLLELLDQLKLGIPINDALRRTMAPLPVLDKQFREFIKQQVAQFAVSVDWNEDGESEYKVAIGALKKLFQEKKYETAIQLANDIMKKYDDRDTAAICLESVASCYEKLERVDDEIETLKALIQRAASNQKAGRRGLLLATRLQNKSLQKTFVKYLLGINPLNKLPHQILSELAIKANDRAQIIRSHEALLELNPFDKAQIHFQLGKAYFENENRVAARRHILLALVEAPRFPAAQKLLLKVSEPQKKTR